MDALLVGILYHGRLLEPPERRPDRITVLIGERMVRLGLRGGTGVGLQSGDLIAFTVRPAAAEGTLPEVDRVDRIGAPAPGARWSEGDALRWRRPGKDPARLALLRLRHEVLRTVRASFDEQGFVEVDTPVLVRAPSPEPQFAPIGAGDEFLITSPEFQLKRLLVGGLDRLYRIGPAFRGGERGRLHNPEFTLLEWYRSPAASDALADDLHGLLIRLVALAEAFAAEHPRGLGDPAIPRLRAAWVAAPLRQVSVADLFRRHLRIDLRGVVTVDALRAAARAAKWPEPDALAGDFDAAFSRLWVALEAEFPPEPLLVVDWPAPLASLARLKPGDPTVAERMELYAGGLELANGFAELTDPAQQRARFEANLARRRALGQPPLPLDEAFLRALEDGMPPSAGMALGLDRLVMLVAGVADIRDVLSFASDER